MTAISDKVKHVRAAGQTRSHACHWPGCERQVPPAMWGCMPHWFRIPKPLRDEIWVSYRIGQEADGRPSRRYVLAAKAVQDWITERDDFPHPHEPAMEHPGMPCGPDCTEQPK